MAVEITIPIKIKLNENAHKIPNCDDMGEIQEGFWDEQSVKEHFGDTFAWWLKKAMEQKDFAEGYMSDICFENLETREDLEKSLGFEVTINDKKVDFKSEL